MALYEYRCENCGEVFELIQKFSDEPLVTHEKCGGKVERLISAPALQFKGSGWYVTDYAKGSGTKPAPNGSSKSSDGSSAPSSTPSKSSGDTSSSSSASSSESKSPSSSEKK